MVIGVTGGVGAGKSTILKILEKRFGAHLIMADDVAKELMEPGGASYEAVVAAFGEEILVAADPDDVSASRPIDRAKLASIVFNDDDKLELVNSLTHPKVKEEILARIARFYEEDENALIAVEAALLIEAGYDDILDTLWIVDADPEVRIERLMRDRGYSREKALSIMDNQLSPEEFRAHGDFVVDNSGTHEDAEAQIEAYFKKGER